MTQDTDKCQDHQLYTDISAWITDAKGLSVFERTGHHGQYEGRKGSIIVARFGINFRTKLRAKFFESSRRFQVNNGFNWIFTHANTVSG